MNFLKRLCISALLASCSLPAATLVQRQSDTLFQCCDFSARAITWTQDATWNDVRIDVQMHHNGANGELYSAVFLLLDSIGPGTTIANEIDDAVVQSTTQGQQWVTAFDGLTLGPGTYYLMHYAVNPSYGEGFLVTYDSSTPRTFGPGVTGVNYLFSQETDDQVYRPANTYNTGWNDGWIFSITGNRVGDDFAPGGGGPGGPGPDTSEVPEPSSAALLLVAGGVLAGVRFIKR